MDFPKSLTIVLNCDTLKPVSSKENAEKRTDSLKKGARDERGKFTKTRSIA